MKFFKFFSKKGKSKEEAKQRLQLVLVQDRTEFNDKALVNLKNDLIHVVGKHLEIDERAMDVALHRNGREIAIVANIPLIQKRA